MTSALSIHSGQKVDLSTFSYAHELTSQFALQIKRLPFNWLTEQNRETTEERISNQILCRVSIVNISFNIKVQINII